MIDAKYPSMTSDALTSAKPIVQPFDSVEKIDHLFDAMSDKKVTKNFQLDDKTIRLDIYIIV